MLVIADFPAKFDEKSAARLAAIAAGGVPCGVLVLVAGGPRPSPLPPGLLRSTSSGRTRASLTWDGARLAWHDRDFGGYPLVLDPPPAAEFATREIQRVGAAAKDAKRVEVPFEFIARPPSATGPATAASGIDVPLGKAGATKRQHLTLGHGTSQHVLIAGRTGSGKSTLMHALITNLALQLQPRRDRPLPDRLQEGGRVQGLRDPRAAARERRRDRERARVRHQRPPAARRRASAARDRFRDAGVQDINGYRNAPGTPPLPRILLIVDEFQEFFVEEDKLAQDAALWLDRLVRQGRAFGIHVLLGSQSLGGAFTLARSTLGQMAVRIALQCSETDAHLILSENNIAPRMLSRPGEAIYNDANGAPRGQPLLPGRLALGRAPRVLPRIDLHETDRTAEAGPVADTDRLRGRRAGRSGAATSCFNGSGSPNLARVAALGPGLARRRDLDQGPDARPVPTPGGEPSADRRPERGGGTRRIGRAPDRPGGAVLAGPRPTRFVRAPVSYVLDGTPEDHPSRRAVARVAGALPHGVEVGGWRE